MEIAYKIARWYGRLFARPSLISFNKFLVHLGMRGLGVYNFGDFFVTGESNFLKQYLSSIDQPVIFDVGANTGSYALLCQQINPNSQIFCFEPHPQTFSLLQKQVQNNKNIKTLNLALSNKSGKLALYDYQDNRNSRHATLCQDVIETVANQTSINFEVPVSTVDEIIIEQRLKKIHLLKVDVEGHDLQVLQGAKSAIANNIVQAIQFEFTKNNSTAKVFMKDFFDLLAKDFIFYRLLPYGLLPLNQYNPSIHEIFAYQNIIGLKRKD